MSAPNRISLTDVRYKVQEKTILDGISLDFSSRCLTGIIGNNGSGKTTLLRLMLGAIPLTAGSIKIDGRNIGSFQRKELARMIAILSQNTFADFAFPCEEVVLMGRNPHRNRFQSFGAEDYHIVEEMMRLTQTTSFQGRLITELSGGEEQTVFLARALTQTPRFLLLDEPTSHLDICRQLKILQLVKSLTDQIGAVLVIHDLNLAARFCDRLVLLSQGKVLAQGTPEEVLTPANIERAFHVHSVIRHDPELSTMQLTFLNKKENEESNPCLIRQEQL